jgi:hypothetical protein
MHMSNSSNNEGPFLVMDARGRNEIKVVLEEGILALGGYRDQVRCKLSQVRSIRLMYAPASEYGPAHYAMALRGEGGLRIRLRANADDPIHLEGYRALAEALHHQLSVQPYPIAYHKGMASKMSFWLIYGSIVAVFSLLLVAVIAGTLRKHNYATGAIFLAVSAVVCYALLRFIAKVAKPGSYDPAAIPAYLLPPKGE